jgi:cold shock CspA family protein
LAAATQEDTQIRQTYKRVFDVCTEKYIGEIAGQDILDLLKVNNDISIENHFNSIRKVLEDLFIAFSKFRLLPIEFVRPIVALNEGSRFLTGKSNEGLPFIEKGYNHLDSTHLPPNISYSLRSILAIVQPGSHRSNIDQYVRSIKTDYLFKSVLFQVLDVITWFKVYIDSNPKTENWMRVDSLSESIPETEKVLVKGKVININIQKGFAFLKPDTNGENVFIPPHLVANYSLKEEMHVEVEIEQYLDNRTSEIKKRVKQILN